MGSKDIPKFKINVEQGVIHVNNVAVLQATPEVILLSIDCKQKYPEIISTGSGTNDDGTATSSILIGISERTLRADLNVLQNANDLNLTEVKIEHGDTYMLLLAEAGRYSITFALIKVSEEFEGLCWWDSK